MKHIVQHIYTVFFRFTFYIFLFQFYPIINFALKNARLNFLFHALKILPDSIRFDILTHTVCCVAQFINSIIQFNSSEQSININTNEHKYHKIKLYTIATLMPPSFFLFLISQIYKQTKEE
jgi:hypothetical protein